MPKSGENVPIRLKLPEAGLPKPEAINWCHFTKVNNDYQMLLGYVDLLAIHTSQQQWLTDGEHAAPVPVEVTHRFLLSDGLLRFFQTQVADILSVREPAQTQEDV
jgi:hypothetical protein